MTLDPQLLTGLGAALAIFLTAYGSAIASSHSGVYAVRGSDYKAFAPIVISGVLAIYGIIVAVLLVSKLNASASTAAMTPLDGYRNLSAGLTVGLACCASGLGMAKFIQQINEHHTATASSSSFLRSDGPESEPLVGRRTVATYPIPTNFLHLCLSLVFLEAIGLYGLIVAHDE
eukprot:CAMPEP_0170343170 /NCGR_PEP_ID=MMETSP0116_2-20130129/72756_1 /TAXON_ID=400756 /ORGANISM="Durinskia baltica, Strain CSIRO CS-38" /LENGTH=173 /DNA_ID=CAMNT_0010596815 /DNA_START=41 /DNA_END=562 /DNA_ORIENTATION=-